MNVSSEFLIEEVLARSPVRHACVCGGESDLPDALSAANRTKMLTWLATDVREIAKLDRTSNVDVVVDDNILEVDLPHSAVDLVLISAMPDRALNRRSLAFAHLAVKPDGDLIVAGANREGIQSAIGDGTAVFGPARFEEYRRKHRIALFRQPDVSGNPAWLSQPGIAPGTWQEFAIDLNGQELSLTTLPGVFAGDKLDAGTALLLEHFDVPAGSRVLDVGCGVGVIGIAAARTGASAVDLIDANLLAVAATNENLKRLLIPNARAFASDVYDAVGDEGYDLIVSNPPFHQGKVVDHTVSDRLIREAPRHLASNGSVLVVANAFLDYGKRMSDVFRQVETIAATRRYHVISAGDPR